MLYKCLVKHHRHPPRKTKKTRRISISEEDNKVKEFNKDSPVNRELVENEESDKEIISIDEADEHRTEREREGNQKERLKPTKINQKIR